jgi:hypothetical protein
VLIDALAAERSPACSAGDSEAQPGRAHTTLLACHAMSIRRVSAASLSIVVALTVHATALAGPWGAVPGASRFVAARGATVRLELQREGGGGCGGGGCSAAVAIRNVQGTLPSTQLSYYYSDRRGSAPGCLGPRRATLFSSWTEVEIAPARGGEDSGPHCGVSMMVNNQMQYWVILRVRTVSEPSPAAGPRR